MGRSAGRTVDDLPAHAETAGPPAKGGGGAGRRGEHRPAGGAKRWRLRNWRLGNWRLRNWRLLTKFAALLVIPLVLAVALGAARISSSVSAAGELAALHRQVELSQQIAGIAHALQHERHLVAAAMATDRAAERVAAGSQISEVDVMIAALRAADVDQDDLTVAVAESYRAVLDQLDGLPDFRAEVLAPDAVADIAIGRYGERIGVLLRFSRLALAGTDASLLATSEAVSALANAKEQVSAQHAVLLASSLVGTLLGFQRDLLRQSSTRFDVAVTEFTEVAPASAEQLYAATVNSIAATDRDGILNSALNLSSLPVPVDPVEWSATSGETADRIRQVEATLLGQLAAESDALSDQARSDAIRDAGIIALAVLLALVFLLFVARSVLGPLRTLRTAAFDIADRQLPAVVERMRTSDGRGTEIPVVAVPVDTEEDIGELARAFDAVHGEAVRLAREQAELRANVNDMFVNLSRRSQGLVERQLQLIDELEDGERDPEQLAALFRLDHLATRMRRNSENLLVLAGAELRHRSGQPVPVLDVLRAAASEIESYRRVMVKPPPGATVAGPVVNDLVHLVAELLDNATAYAPPESPVSVASAMDAGGNLLVEIADVGVGLEPDRLEMINRRLAEPPRVDVSVSRQMGLFVVGRLAARHGVTVRLTSSRPGAGVTARVQVPGALIRRDDALQGSAVTSTSPERTELFGPAPAAASADPSSGQPSVADPSDPLFGSRTPGGAVDAGTPIFEQVASAWFRDLRTIPAAVRAAEKTRSTDWGSAADEGWKAARALEYAGGTADVTAAGLPKRRPRAHLVPGAASTGGGELEPAEHSSRNADIVRGRLSSYQRGVREGREALRGRAGSDTESSDGDKQ